MCTFGGLVLMMDLRLLGIGNLRTPASPMKFPTEPPVPPAPAPLLGMHTDEVLADVLQLSPTEIGTLHDDGVVASAVELT